MCCVNGFMQVIEHRDFDCNWNTLNNVFKKKAYFFLDLHLSAMSAAFGHTQRLIQMKQTTWMSFYSLCVFFYRVAQNIQTHNTKSDTKLQRTEMNGGRANDEKKTQTGIKKKKLKWCEIYVLMFKSIEFWSIWAQTVEWNRNKKTTSHNNNESSRRTIQNQRRKQKNGEK